MNDDKKWCTHVIHYQQQIIMQLLRYVDIMLPHAAEQIISYHWLKSTYTTIKHKGLNLRHRW